MALSQAGITRPAAPDADARVSGFADHFAYLCRMLRRLGVPPAQVEDLAQDVFVVMCRRWPEFQEGRPLRPWLAGIAGYVARRHQARAWRETPAQHIDRQDETPPLDEQLDRTRAQRLVQASLEVLSAGDRDIVVLHEIEGVAMQEVAASLSVPLFTAYTRLRRARQRFARAVLALQAKERESRAAGAPLSASALLMLERQPLSISPRAVERGRTLARAALARPPSGRDPGEPAPARPAFPRPRLVGALLGVAALGLVSGVALLAGRGRPGAAKPTTAPAPRASAAREGPRGWGALAPAAVPALRTAPPWTASGLAEGLTGYWRFDDVRGSALARDLSGRRWDCVLHDLDPAAAWVSGAAGGALEIAGGWVECPRPPQPARASAALSVSAWVRVGQLRGQRAIVARQLVGRGDAFLLSLMWGRLKVRSTLWGKSITAARRIPVDRWVHVAFTHTADGTTRLYQDGVEVGVTQQRRLPREPAIRTPVAIGVDVNGPDNGERGQGLMGAVDEVALYDRALAAEQVAALAGGAQPPASP
jgi:RNA polymerase sigma-70 factor (ECF subfamily)